MMRRRDALRSLVAGGLLCPCAGWGCARTHAPLSSIKIPFGPGRFHDRLLVMIPGWSDDPEIFFRHGFYRELCRAGVEADVRFLDSRLRDYRRREIVERLRDEVLAPARAAGYRDIWIVGASIGGFAAMYSAMEHPELVDGIVAFSPFLGRMATTTAIRRAGGLRSWTPPPPRDQDFSSRLWQWLQDYVCGEPPVPLYLAYGSRENDLLWGYSLLANELPPQRVFTHRGIHGWKTWKPMWPRVIQRVWGDRPYADDRTDRAR